MIQEQLVDYVSSQMKLGVSRDAIKSALVSAGWVAADVEDTLKKVEGGSAAGAMTGAGGVPAGGVASKPAVAGMAVSSAKTAEPQMIRVSDLVSSSSPNPSPAKSSKDAFFGGKISGNSFQATAAKSSAGVAGAGGVVVASSGGSKKMLIGGIVAVILILAFAGLAWYFYSGNATLAAQVASLTGESASVTSQISSLKSQLDASTTDFAAQMASLTTANADLALDLSFYAVPPGGSSSTVPTALPITVTGLLSDGGKAPFAITTAEGAKIFVGNSSVATIMSQLKPLVGQTVQLTGTYIPGSDQMTMNSVSTSTTQ